MQANFIKKRKKTKLKAKVMKSIEKTAERLKVDIFICFLIYFAAQIGRNI